MATTTTNFGWDIPQSTDLVKDGATAIAALGQDIDTSMMDLKGGTTGQVLSKASNTDMDFSWVAQDDSNAIQNAIVDAKGDLISATAADTPARLAVGSDYAILSALSSESTGLKWTGKSTSYTPTWVADVTSPSIGNGSLTGSYLRIGDLVYFSIRMVAGSTTTFGSGDWSFGLPIAMSSQYKGIVGVSYILDSGTTWYGGYFPEGAVSGTLGTVRLRANSGVGASVTSTVPMTWAVNDAVTISGVYNVG